MTGTRCGASTALVVLAALVIAAGCKSNSAAPGAGGAAGSGAAGTGGGPGGTSGAGGSGFAGSDAGGDGCAPTSGAGGGIDPQTGCANAYILPHYDGDICGLCDPGVSTQCSNASGCDWAAVETVTCSPDGSVCAVFGSACSGGPECGWGGVPACAALFGAASQEMNNPTPGSRPGACSKDDQCGPGHYCNVRVANRMFCDNGRVFYAKDYCPDAGTDSGADGADAGVDAADAGIYADAGDAGL